MLVAGVHSGVGKTLVSNGLQTYWRRYHPEQTVDQLMLPTLTPNGIERGLEPDLALLWRSLYQPQPETDVLCIDSEGSLASPITRDTTIATLAKEWRLPVLLVVPVAWEAIALSIATLALARDAKTTIVGLILNQHQPHSDISPEAMADILQSLTHTTILGIIPFLEQPHDDHTLNKLAFTLMLDVVLEKLDTLNA